MRQLEHVDVADGDRLVELVAAHAVEQVDLAGVRQTCDFEQVADFRFARAVEYRRSEGNSFTEAFGIFEQLIVTELRERLPHRRIRKHFAEPAAQRFSLHFLAEQALETIAKLLGDSLKRLLSKEVKAEALRRWFREVFTDTAVWKTLAKLSDDELLEYAEGFREGIPFATPVFDGAREPEIRHLLEVAGLPHAGKINLFDGMSGDQFDQPVTVGYIYMLKLSHLVDDKIHARSIGPYSLITQQPLGGKAQFGGQRFGEMEVWALEAYGAAHILQELLTAKSDDVAGRSKIYEAIVKGEADFDPGLPESFNVLVRELQSLCLDVELVQKNGDADEPIAEAVLEEV